MRILPKKYFSWREPRPFLALLDEHERRTRQWWRQPLGMFLVCLFAMFGWYVAHLNPTKHPPPFAAVILMGVALGAFLAYFIPWLNTKLPSQITVLDRYIVRARGHAQRIRFADLTSFALRTAPEFSTLILTHRRGGEIFVGVPPDIPSDTLSTFLSGRLSPNEPNA